MQDYRVELDSFFGPLDLLLYLVRRHEIDLHNIPIAKLTEQYLNYLQKLKEINIDLVGEFLVMAATLLEIKSQMLLPLTSSQEEGSQTTTELLDPRHTLVQQLLQYKQFKDAAMALDDQRERWADRFARQPGSIEPPDGLPAEPDGVIRRDFDLEDMNVLDLTEAFSRILESVGQRPSHHEIIADDTPIALHAEDLLDRLRREGPITLQSVFVGRTNRNELIGLFLAMLELVSQKSLRVYQDQIDEQIKLELKDPAPVQDEIGEQDWRDPQTGEIQYEWPSDEIRQRVERRLQRRAERRANGKFGDNDEEEVIDIDEEEV